MSSYHHSTPSRIAPMTTPGNVLLITKRERVSTRGDQVNHGTPSLEKIDDRSLLLGEIASW